MTAPKVGHIARLPLNGNETNSLKVVPGSRGRYSFNRLRGNLMPQVVPSDKGVEGFKQDVLAGDVPLAAAAQNEGGEGQDGDIPLIARSARRTE